jgi:uncharacterized protein (TIGR00369 family)
VGVAGEGEVLVVNWGNDCLVPLAHPAINPAFCFFTERSSAAMPNWKHMLDVATSGMVRDDQLSPYMRFLKLPMISRWQDKTVFIDWQASADVHQDSGMVFGGYISALADYAAGSVMLTILETRDLFFTKRLDIEYKRPIRQGAIMIQASILSQQDINVIVEVSFTNPKGDVHAVAQVYQSIFHT